MTILVKGFHEKKGTKGQNGPVRIVVLCVTSLYKYSYYTFITQKTCYKNVVLVTS